MENQQNVRITRSRSKHSSTVDTSSAGPILPLVKIVKNPPKAIENQDLEQNKRSKQSSTVDISSALPILPKDKKQPKAIENQLFQQNIRITRSRSKQIQAINDDKIQNNIDSLLAQMKPFHVVLDAMAVQNYYEQKKVETTSQSCTAMENQQNVRITRSRSKHSSTVDTSSARPILPLVKIVKNSEKSTRSY